MRLPPGSQYPLNSASRWPLPIAAIDVPAAGSVERQVAMWTAARDHLPVANPPFVPPDFVAPLSLETTQFRLEPLGPQHNDADYAAWSSSVEHIHATPGWEDSAWPDGRSVLDNLRDLRRHAEDFANRRGFTYTVLDPATADVVGCVYIYPNPRGAGALVESWVRASRAELDVPLWRAVGDWLASAWPFEHVTYASRPGRG